MRCAKAERLVQLAELYGWESTIVYEADFVDVQLTSRWSDPDTLEGWEWGTMLRWYEQPRGWRLGALDNAGKRVVGGVAIRLADGRRAAEYEFWLGSVRMLEGFIVEPAGLVEWLDATFNEREAAGSRRANG